MLTTRAARLPREAAVLLVFFFRSDRFEIFRFKNLTAIEAFDVIDPVTTG